MFRPFRKLLVKMRDYLRTLNNKELFQLEKLLCTNEQIDLNASTTADENAAAAAPMNTDDQKPLTTTNVTIVGNETSSGGASQPQQQQQMTTSRSNENFYTMEAKDKSGEWVSEEAEGADEETDDDNSEGNYANLGTVECATGFLVPNTNLGNLLQSTVAPLTYNIISNSPPNTTTTETLQRETTSDEASQQQQQKPDSGMGSEDRSPEQENQPGSQYEENWEGLRKIVEPSTSHRHHHRHKSEHKKSKRSKKQQQQHHLNSSSSDDTSTTSNTSSSAASSPTSSSSSDSGKDIVSRRMKFKSTENLLHRLFVCIAGVADQLQTNFAADLRQILRSVFLMNCTQEEEEKPEIIDETKSKDNQQDLFEFRASEENVIRQSNSNHGSIGSQQSICSAEEVNPESDQEVFEEESVMEADTQDDNELDSRHKRVYGNRLSGRSISLSDDSTSSGGGGGHTEQRRNYSISSSPSTSHPQHLHHHQQQQKPPKWIPDHAAPRCMDCESQFTAFRRRHHCRNCGGIFCGVCSSGTKPLPKYGLTKPVRVCRVCYEDASTTATTAAPAPASVVVT